MIEYQKRVIIEKEELDKKIVKLTTFLFSKEAAGIKRDEAKRMLQQTYAMIDYSRILDKRVASFSK